MKKQLKRPILKLLWRIGALSGSLFDRPLRKEKISAVLIFQGGGIGDVIRLFPALQSLSEALPRARIVALTQFGEALFRLFPSPEIVAEHIIYDLRGCHRSFFGKLALIRKLRKKKFHMIFAPTYGLGMIEAAVISFLIGAPYRIGFDTGGAGFLYTTRKDLVSDKSILEQNLDLLSRAGFPAWRPSPYLRVPEEELAWAGKRLAEQGVSGRDALVAVAPEVKRDSRFESFPEYRSWPVPRYLALIERVIEARGAKVLLLGNPVEDGQDFIPAGLLQETPRRVLDFRGKTTVSQAAALIACSTLFVGNDSGPLHLATALGKPCVSIFGATSPRQVIPPGELSLPIWKHLPCSPCFSHQPLFELRCPYQIACLNSIEVEEVFGAVARLLDTTAPAAPG